MSPPVPSRPFLSEIPSVFHLPDSVLNLPLFPFRYCPTSQSPLYCSSNHEATAKQNMTGPGRPGREHQASLTALAAQGDPLHWDYGELLARMLACARPLREVRNAAVPAMGEKDVM